MQQDVDYNDAGFITITTHTQQTESLAHTLEDLAEFLRQMSLHLPVFHQRHRC